MALSALMLCACQSPSFAPKTPDALSDTQLSSWVTPRSNSPSDVPALPNHLTWEGRVVIDVESTPPSRLTGPFALEMIGDSGTLRLYGPLGSTAALLSWGKNWATLQSSQLKPKEQNFSSLGELMQYWIGTPIELEDLMPGLLGQQNAQAGWQFADNRGKVKTAQRLFPAPSVSIKLILDDPPSSP